MDLFSRIRNYLRQPEEADFSFERSWPHALSVATAITLLVYFISFRGSNFSFSQQIFYSLIFGAITLVVSLFNDLVISRIFPTWFDEDKWTLGKSINYIIWNFLGIAIANTAFFIFMGWASLSLSSFYQISIITITIGILPIVVLALFRHNQKLSGRLQEAIAMNQQLHNTYVKNNPSTKSKVSTNNGKQITIASNQQNINIPLDNFLYATSEKNYFRIVLDGDKELVIRNTLKNLEQALQSHPTIIRCHRAFVVETSRVIGVSGNAQGYRLSLEGSSKEIPVSRSYISSVKKLIG